MSRRILLDRHSLPLDCQRADSSPILAMLVRHSLQCHSLALTQACVTRRAQLNNFSDGSISVGNIAWRGNAGGNPNLREVTEPFPAAPANCTMRQMRQVVPKVPQPANGHALTFHTLSGCWVDPAQARPSTSMRACLHQYKPLGFTPHSGKSINWIESPGMLPWH